MKGSSRRSFLKLCAQSAPALLAAKFAMGESRLSTQSVASLRTPDAIDRFIDPLPRPGKLTPSGTGKTGPLYRVKMTEFKRKMHSQLPPTRLWGFEGQYPGPTFDVFRGKPIEVEWENALPKEHIFTVDPHIHGAMPPTPAVRAVPHLHGARTAPESDGLPEKWFLPGATAHYFYPNSQEAATLWYHDHAVGITRLNVYAGLSGFYLLRDEREQAMNLPAGDYEIPLLLQDRSLDADGQLLYTPSHDDGVKLPPGVWGPEFFGDYPVVNGVIFPFLEVEPRPYRLRILNGSNSRFLNLFFNTAKHPTDIPNLIPFNQIGSDGGFLPKPAQISKIQMGPAERADLILDFTGLEGKTVTLSNNASAPFPGWDMMMPLHPALYEWMQFRVTLPKAANAKTVAITMPPFTKIDESAVTKIRDFVLSERIDAAGHSLGVRINDKGYDDPVTEKPTLGSTEKWRFINTTEDAHPMHLHLVQFQILHRQGFNLAAYQTSGELHFVGAPRMPAANEAGWKDTAVVNPRDVLTILVRFEGYTGRYVYHCHMLEHEDNDMMRPYEVVA